MIDEPHSNEDLTRRSYQKPTYAALAGVVLLLLLRYIILPQIPYTSVTPVIVAVLWLIVIVLSLTFIGGLVVLTRHDRDQNQQPDLFNRYFSRVPESWNAGWRCLVRPLFGPTLRPGDIVSVRNTAEILAMLDKTGKLDGLPFMPEMLAFQGRNLMVDRRIDKINDWIGGNEKRKTKGIVTLVGVRCDGAAHGGCQALCQIYWNERWLHRVKSPNANQTQVQDSQSDQQNLEQHLLSTVSRQVQESDKSIVYYMCQITELLHISTPLSQSNFLQDLRPLLNGNLPLRGWLIGVLTVLFNKLQALRRGVGYPVTAPTLEKGPTPVAQLNLRPGEKVKVRNKYEIGMTLYKNLNRGIWFGDETLRFCNHQYRVRSCVEHIIDERSGKMIKINPPCIILESVCATGEFLRFCPQNEYVFWREIWLERVEPR